MGESRRPSIRPYADGDLGRIVRLFERESQVPVGADGLTVDEVTDLLVAPDAEALVAEQDGDVVGMAVASVSGVIGSVFRVVGQDDTCRRLLEQLESRLVDRGARKLAAVVQDGSAAQHRFSERGYAEVDGMVVLQRDVSPTTAGATQVAELGGTTVDPGVWEGLHGMEHVKQIIERRIILPLTEADLAERHGVSTPSTVLLFGPPGTGKTSFAKGAASRLRWPFIPLEPSQFTDSAGERGSRRLADAFERVLSLPAAVAFVDEVEDLASARHEARRVDAAVTNEFLRQLPRFAGAPHHLLICATNRVGDLDPAFLRPGRFDYIVPVGPPDDGARAEMWRGFVRTITDQDIDVDAVVAASRRFTPADIQFAAQKAAQLAFEREYFGSEQLRATTDDLLEAIDRTRPSITDEMIAAFEEDAERFART